MMLVDYGYSYYFLSSYAFTQILILCEQVLNRVGLYNAMSNDEIKFEEN